VGNIHLNDDGEVISPIQVALKAGVVLGPVSIVIYYVAYFIDVEILTSTWLGFAMLAISIALVIYYGIDYRNDLGGFMPFGIACQFVFFTLVISGLITTVGYILLFQVIDPSLPGILAEAQLESALAMMDHLGQGNAMTSDRIVDMRRELEESR